MKLSAPYASNAPLSAAQRWRNQPIIAAGRQKSPSNRKHPAASKQAHARLSTVSSLTLAARPRAISQPSFGISGLSKEAMASPTSRPTRPLPVVANRYCQSLLRKSAQTITGNPKPVRNTETQRSFSEGNRNPMNRFQYLCGNPTGLTGSRIFFTRGNEGNKRPSGTSFYFTSLRRPKSKLNIG